MVALVVVSCASAGLGQTGYAQADVMTTVTSNIQVGSGELGIVPIPTPQAPGPFSGTVRFRVDANTQIVSMQVWASQLYKDGAYADDTDVIPLFTGLGGGVKIDILNGSAVRQPLGAANDPLGWGGTTPAADPAGISNFKGLLSVIGFWGSGNGGHFSEDVLVTPTWELLVETPQGDYMGQVQLWATVVPQFTAP
jgi:hypothetical protein